MGFAGKHKFATVSMSNNEESLSQLRNSIFHHVNEAVRELITGAGLSIYFRNPIKDEFVSFVFAGKSNASNILYKENQWLHLLDQSEILN
jgi:hypothetical protein